MFEINGCLLVLLLFSVNIMSVCSGWVDPTRVFLEPFDQNTLKKSCGHGMLAGKDYFVLNGLVNISGVEYAEVGMTFIYIRRAPYWDNYEIVGSEIMLSFATCKNLDKVPIDTCKCMFKDLKYVRVKCNITAKLEYSRGDVKLLFATKSWYISPSLPLPVVYGTSSCTATSHSRAAKSNPEGLTALIGPALLCTAVVIDIFTRLIPYEVSQ